MTQVHSAVLGEVDAIRSDGVVFPHESNVGCTLASGTTYYFVVGDKDATYKSIHFKWDASIIITSIAPYVSNEPKILGGMGGGGSDTSDFINGASAKGDWLLVNPTTATLYFTSDDGTTGGVTVSGGTSVAVAGGTAGGVVYDMGNVPAARMRFKVVVAGTGGKLRCCVSGKE